MDNYHQLELFDLQTYTSELIAKDLSKVTQIRKKSKEKIKYEQLTLNLFPSQPSEDFYRVLKQSA